MPVVDTMEVRMKRIIALLVLLITTATVATVGQGWSAAFADNGVLHGNGGGRSAPDAPAAMGVLAGLAAPAVHAVSVLWYPTSNVWTDSNASAECRALGQQEVASGDWDAYSCRSDPSVSPSAVRLWTGVWVGCPTCIAVKSGDA
jgi:hypothetical protein